jgi:hypothetical protein
MNCKHVEELLPLYVGRDLEEDRARLITTHVQGCTQCARTAQEYGEANQLLQLFEPPQFSEASYAAVRRSVLREIERESRAPQSIFALEFLRRAFQPRLMWAVSTAVLLGVCVFAYYFIANRTSGQRHEQAKAASQQDNLKSSPSPSSEDLKPAPTGTSGGRGTTGSRVGVPDSPALATNSHKPRLNQTVWRSQRAGESSTPAGLTGRGPRAPAVPVTSAQYSPVEPKDATPNTSVTSDKTLRLEIQTSDRNIRIIWFSHPHTNEGSPSESSKGI